MHPVVCLNSFSGPSMKHCPFKANVCSSFPDNSCLLSRFLVVDKYVYIHFLTGKIALKIKISAVLTKTNHAIVVSFNVNIK